MDGHKIPSLKLGDLTLYWLRGGAFALDGGAMFGVVPKALWSKKYPSAPDNTIPMIAWPLLIDKGGELFLVETGLGNKLTEKQKKIFRVSSDWQILEDLSALKIHRHDIGHVILTHYDFDHAGGVVMDDSGRLELTFPNARHYLQKAEWEDVLSPNIRSINTFWPVNNEALRDSGNLDLLDGNSEIAGGIRTVLTGGHNRGFQLVEIASQSERALQLVDLLPTHAHFNPLWIMAYDNFPFESIAAKEQWIKAGVAAQNWFTFYHDPFHLACKFDEKGSVLESLPGPLQMSQL